jgi:hypothetical protein
MAEDRSHVAVGVEEDRERGRRIATSGNTAPISAVQPMMWCRKAARENSHPFCSWISSAAPETARASGRAKCQARLCSLPRRSPSSAAPASIIVCAQAPWATMWIVEFVKKTITGHISTPSAKSRLGQR